MKRYILSLLSLVVLAACSSYDESIQKPIDETTDNNNIVEKYFVYANIDNTSNTRVDITPSTNAGGNPIIKVNWEESGEKFLVYRNFELFQSPYNATAYQFSQVSGNQFTGDIKIYDIGYSAFYNCSLSLGQSGTHTHKMNYDMSEQNGTGDKVLMMGESQETGVIDFDHLGFVLKPTFKYNSAGMDDWEDIDASITKIEMGGVQYVNTIDNNSTSQSITVTPSALNDIFIFLPKLKLYPFSSEYGTNASYRVNYDAGHTFTFTVITNDGKEYTAESLILPDSPTLEAGKFYTATIKLSETVSYLPSASVFRSELVNFIKNSGGGVTGIKFVPNSTNRTGTELTGTKNSPVRGSRMYFMRNNSYVEIHSAAKKFVFPSNCADMFQPNNNIEGEWEVLTNIITFDLRHCDTSEVTTMARMFKNCRHLIVFDYTEGLFDTSNVTDMSEMFAYAGWDQGYQGMHATLKFNTSKVTNMRKMFDNLGVVTLDISSFDMSNVTSVEEMFNATYYMGELRLGEFNIPEVCEMNNILWRTGSSCGQKGYIYPTIYYKNDDIINRLKATNVDNKNIHWVKE